MTHKHIIITSVRPGLCLLSFLCCCLVSEEQTVLWSMLLSAG